MVARSFWIRRIETAWERRSVVWLSGVRRVGKTVLSQTLGDIEYFDCEIPRDRGQMDDPEGFLRSLEGKRVVLDEVHRLAEPSQLLKIAADYHPSVRILATGSSTLQASTRFRDTLTGRKVDVWLTPMMSADLADFSAADLPHRLRRGGLPPFFLAQSLAEREYEEWIDAYWARDIQELFRLERRWSFQRLLELLMASSGGLFEASRLAAPCEIGRTTVSNYLDVLAATHVAHVVKPFSSRRSSEIVSMPRVYGFDTGFVCHFKGWDTLRPGDLGLLWEHYVLNELHAQLAGSGVRICHWRDKRGHEVDFVIVRATGVVAAIECKWAAEEFEPAGLQAFRLRYLAVDGSTGCENWVVASDVERPYRRTYRDIEVEFIGLPELSARAEGLGCGGTGQTDIDRGALPG